MFVESEVDESFQKADNVFYIEADGRRISPMLEVNPGKTFSLRLKTLTAANLLSWKRKAKKE